MVIYIKCNNLLEEGMNLRWLKPLIGILLIAVSIGGLLFWEICGRDALLMEEIMVAKEDILAGTKVVGNMFTTKGIPKENKLDGALLQDDIHLIQGKVTAQLILKNDQVSPKYFREDEFYLDTEESLFVLEPNWIAMRSSALRRGDVVDIYGADGRGVIGTFQVAFVKDSTEREIRDVNIEGKFKMEDKLLERTDSTSIIEHIEIIATINEYEELVACATGVTPTALIIVQKGNKYDK